MGSEQQDESRRYGRALAKYLSAGGALQPVASGVPLIPGEQCFGIAQGELLAWSGPAVTAGTWSPVDSGRLHVTGLRLLFDGRDGRLDLPLSSIRSSSSSSTGDRLELDTTDAGRIGIELPYSDYWTVLLTWLTRGAILQPSRMRD